MTPAMRQAIAKVVGAAITQANPLTGGCIGDVWLVRTVDGRQVVAKTAGADGALDVEGYLLDYLARTHTVPVPGVLHAEPGWCVHVGYSDLMRDALGTIRRIYAHFDAEPSRLHERRVEAWLEERHQSVHGRHGYDPADFGWS